MKKWRSGFTLIELSLSLVFVGILALTVALITNNMIATYRRGLTLNSINETGMGLVDDMRAAFASSSAKSVQSACESLYDMGSKRSDCLAGGGKGLTVLNREENIDGVGRVPVYGVLCTGTYSYLWNSGYTLSGKYDNQLSLEYESGGSIVTADGFGLLKVEDRNRSVCLDAQAGENVGHMKSSSKIKVGEELKAEPEVLLKVDGNDNSLALYDLSMATPAESDAINGIFYSVSFILGTLGGGVNVTGSGNYCAPPEGDSIEESFDYCAINKFNFAMQATGE